MSGAYTAGMAEPASAETAEFESAFARRLDRRLAECQRAIGHIKPLQVKGRVKRLLGTVITATAPAARIGELCWLHDPHTRMRLPAEVIGLNGDEVILTPLGDIKGMSDAAEVTATGTTQSVGVGPGLLGRVLDGLGMPMDLGEQGPLEIEKQYPVIAEPPSPLIRRPIQQVLPLGVRSIDSLLTCGEGQRIGIFAAAGGGKTSLLSMLVRNTEAEVCVVALIGERGREVGEFLEHSLGQAGRKRSVIVVSTSDRPAMERVKAAYVATAVAEYFRDRGRRVLLLMDSVTRFGRALREIGLAAGEPPTRRGFPPSVFATLPRLMERAGNSDRGSITAFYTVLVEGDDMDEPIADETRSILDGHVVLSKKLARANHYPAIDVLASVSRVMPNIADGEHQQSAGRMRALLAKYNEIELLVRVGEYQRGSDPQADLALEKHADILRFLQQGMHERANLAESLNGLHDIVSEE